MVLIFINLWISLRFLGFHFIITTIRMVTFPVLLFYFIFCLSFSYSYSMDIIYYVILRNNRRFNHLLGGNRLSHQLLSLLLSVYERRLAE